MSKNILAKIAKVQEEVGSIPKNGRGPSSKGGFEFVKFDDVVLSIRDLFIKHKIVQSVETLEHTVKAEQVGNRMVVNSWVRVKYTFFDVESGEAISSISAGEGSDIGGDTATRKAFSQAWKIILLQTFNIVTGDEVDSDGEEARDLPTAAQTATAQSVGDLKAEIGKRIAGYTNEATGEVRAPFAGGGEAVNALGDKLHPKDTKRAWSESVKGLTTVLAEMDK